MMCRIKGQMDNGWHYDVQSCGWIREGIIMCK